ncbi:MAG: hypothetical protein M3550_01950 [Actinomycetota bacterium]|nr:hypothetical protein [Actinomycetota bacterium]
MDVAKYRKRYEAKLAKAATSAEKSAGAPLGEQNLEEQVADLLVALQNRDEPVASRTAALEALAALDFLGPRFAPFRARYKEALRDVATDQRRELRAQALELLAIDRDPYAQELLVQGLQEPKNALVPEAKAIQLLGYDDHAEVVPLVREVYERATGAAREEALRVLATDPESEQLFTRLLKDKSEKRSIRQLSASGLQSLNPEAFNETAHKIVADEDDYNDIRATALAALTHGREARETPFDLKLVETVQKVGESTRSQSIRSAARRFLQSTEQ